MVSKVSTISVLLKISFCIVFLTNSFIATAQENFKKDSTFFKSQKQAYQHWLESTQLHLAFQTTTLEIQPALVRLNLKGTATTSSCEDLQKVWIFYKKKFDKKHGRYQLFHEKLLETWSVLTEIPTDSLEIFIHCNDPTQFSIRIFGEPNGAIRFQEENQTAMGNGLVKIPFEHLDTIYTGQKLDSIGRLKTVRRVRLAITDFLLNDWYKGKGTPILHNVRIDTTESYYNEFTFEFSRISHEILEEGYFEYHRIKVEVQEKNEQIEFSWTFTGKFGSGILFPPRRNDYKLMETYYQEDLERYETKLFKLISERLKQEP